MLKHIALLNLSMALLIGALLYPKHIFAESLTNSNILGIKHIESNSFYSQNTGKYIFTDKYKIILDNNYIGTFTINVRYASDNFTINCAVNGSTCEYELTGSHYDVVSWSITSSNVNINSDNIYTFPMESMATIHAMETYGYPKTDLVSLDYGIYPIYQLNANDEFSYINVEAHKKATFVFFTNKSTTPSTIQNYFTWNQNLILEKYDLLGYAYGSSGNRILKLVFRNDNNSAVRVQLKAVANNTLVAPIYFSQNDYIKNLSFDFATMINEQNQFMIELLEIKNGDNETQDVKDNIDTATDVLNEKIQDIDSYEQQFQSQMTNNLEAIDTELTLNDFGTQFISSSNWLKQRFDYFTEDTPFGLIITFTLTLGLAMLVLGKLL